MVVAWKLPLETAKYSHGEATSTQPPPSQGSIPSSEGGRGRVDEWVTYHACEVWIPGCVNPKCFHHDPFSLVCRLVYVRKTTPVERILLNSLKFCGKSKRSRENSRDTAQLLQALEVFPCISADPNAIKRLMLQVRGLVVMDTQAPAHLIKFIRDLLGFLTFHIHHFLDPSVTPKQERSGFCCPVSHRPF